MEVAYPSIVLYRIVVFVLRCLAVLSLWMFGFALIEFPEVLGSRVLGFLGLWLFNLMTLRPGSAASRSLNNFERRAQGLREQGLSSSTPVHNK